MIFFFIFIADEGRKRSESGTKTDDETLDKMWEDTDKDCEQNEQSANENNNEDEDEASIER